VLQMAYLGF